MTLVKRNTSDPAGDPPATIQYSNIRILDNQIENSVSSAIAILNAKDVVLKGNVLTDVAFEKKGYGIFIDRNGGIEIDCTQVKNTSSKHYESFLGFGENANQKDVVVHPC